MSRDAVEQSFWRHPLDGETTLQKDDISLAMNSLCTDTQSLLAYVRGLLVVVDKVDVSSQAKICYLHHILVCDQHVPGGQVSVDTLANNRGVKTTSSV